MSRQHLVTLIDQYNFWPKYTGKGRVLDVNTLTQKDAEDLYHKIDGDLSPENLTCDGELSPAKVRQKAAMLHGAVAELDKRFHRPADLWCIN